MPGAAAPGSDVHVTGFALQEGYNTGWAATAAVLGRRPESERFTAGQMMGAVMASGVVAGRPAMLHLTLEGGVLEGTTVRFWPSVVDGLEPYELDRNTVACNVSLVDPVSFLAGQPIWGAYRSMSAGEMIGGALSLAAGGDGKPTLSPVLPNLPAVRIVEGYRDSLKQVPHAIAAGETLGDWLAEFLALLGLRAELTGFRTGSVDLELMDALPTGQTFAMTVVEDDKDEAFVGEQPDPSSYGPIHIRGHAGFPGPSRRGGLLDDPTTGSPRPVVALGAVGTVLTGPGLDLEEASGRVIRSMLGRYAEMLMLSAISRQPRCRPGELVRLSRPAHGFEDWQIAGVLHMVRGGVYDNDLTLLRGDIPWHPELPIYRPPAYVTGVVDGGPDFHFHEPVPRDRMGRVQVSFPFTPTETSYADTNQDGRVTVADFDDSHIESFKNNSAEWEEELARYEEGSFDDPFPGRPDDDLTSEELAYREELRTRRENVRTYTAYKEASADRDHDGAVTGRDLIISDELSEALSTEEGRQEMQSWWNTREDREQFDRSEEERVEARAEKLGEITGLQMELAILEAMSDEVLGSMDTSYGSQSGGEVREDQKADLLAQISAAEAELALLEIPEEQVKEFGTLFEHDHGEELSDEVLAAREEAADAGERWPPKIPLPIVEPMAGAMHGFIAAHRHGDICRVAVHSPLNAEILGFQYRDDRQINVDLAGAVAGLVVEHNYAQSWSGLVFKRTDAVESPVTNADGEQVEDAAGEQVEDADGEQVEDAAGEQVEDADGEQVEDADDEQVEDADDEQVQDNDTE